MVEFIDSPPYRWRTQRVFLSSTFRDFHAERDYLIKFVFPDLRTECAKWKIRLVDIDLRWGITEEQAKSFKVLELCLKQVDGCRPFFLGFLGSRYGWVPEANADQKEFFEQALSQFGGLDNAVAQGMAMTHLEIRHAVLDPFQSVETVKAIPHSFFYFRKPEWLKPEIRAGLTDDQFLEFRRAFFDADAESNEPIRAGMLENLKQELREHFEKAGEEQKCIYESY